MKKTIAILVLGLLVLALLPEKDTSAAENEVAGEVKKAMEEVSREVEAAMQEVEQELQAVEAELTGDEIQIFTGLKSMDSRTPKMGVYLSDLTFKRAWQMHYPYCHGVLITGTTSDGAANKAGLMEDDIVMEFDNVPVRHEDHLVSLIRSHTVGDLVQVKYFRYGEEGVAGLVLQSASGDIVPLAEVKEGEEPDEVIIEKKKHTPGDGGIGWYPIWYTPYDLVNKDDPDMLSSMNHILTALEFQEMPDERILMNGLGLKGNVGKGWMIGGQFGYYGDRRSGNTEIDPTTDVTRRLHHSFMYGGITFEKRLPIFSHVIPSLGCMVGWGNSTVTVDQLQSSDYDWNNIPNTVNNTYNSHLELYKNYLLVQPTASILVRFTDWLGIMVEGGYLLSYSKPGWRNRVIEEDFEMENSPNTTMEGYTIMVGPWFGF